MSVVVFATSFLDEPLSPRETGSSGKDILDRLALTGLNVDYRCDRDTARPLSPAELDGVSAIIADLERYEADLLSAVGPVGGGALRLIVRYGVGYDSIDMPAATAAGVIVCNTPGANSRPTAEWAVSTILAVVGRRLPHHERAAAGMRKTGPSRLDLSGKTVGVVGTGAIGKLVVQLLSGFDVSVLAHDPYPDAGWASRVGATYVDLPDLLRQSDVVTLHAATDKRIIGETELSLLKPGSALVNCARGVMVDNEAAWRAVKDGRLWGYGLDEIWNHPELPLEGLNIVVSPHVGADTYSGKDRMQRMSAEAIAAFVESGSPPHVLNPEVLDR